MQIFFFSSRVEVEAFSTPANQQMFTHSVWIDVESLFSIFRFMYAFSYALKVKAKDSSSHGHLSWLKIRKLRNASDLKMPQEDAHWKNNQSNLCFCEASVCFHPNSTLADLADEEKRHLKQEVVQSIPSMLSPSVRSPCWAFDWRKDQSNSWIAVAFVTFWLTKVNQNNITTCDSNGYGVVSFICLTQLVLLVKSSPVIDPLCLFRLL